MEIMKRLLLLLFFVFIHYIIVSQTYEGIFYISDSTKAFGKILPKGTVVVDRQTANIWIITATTTATTKTLASTTTKESVGGAGASFIDIDLDRAVKRGYEVGITISGDNIEDFVDYIYYAPPTISIAISPTTTVYEVGTTNSITISGVTTNNGDVLSNGQIRTGATVLYNFTSAETYSKNISFTPRQILADTFTDVSYAFRTYQDYVGTESGTASSSTITIYGVYPVLYGISASDYHASLAGAYSDIGLTHLIQAEGNKTVNLSGSGYIYFIFPDTWVDETLSSILDHNGFENITNFTKYSPISMTSSGLAVDWTQNYIVYQSEMIVSGVSYVGWQFKQ